MSTLKTGNRELLKIGLGAIICSTILTVAALIVALSPAPNMIKGIIQIIVFVSCVTGTVLCFLAGEKKFVVALCIYVVLLVVSILLMALTINKTTAFVLELCLYLFDAVAKLLILIGFREINYAYNKNERVNKVFIFICLVFAIVRIVFHIVVFAVPAEEPSSIDSINNVTNAFGILSEAFFFTVIALTYNAVNHHQVTQ